MRKLIAFSSMTLDGYVSDAHGGIDWAHSNEDDGFNAFVAENAKKDGPMLLGRKTYEMMASFWPTPFAMEAAPVVAERMNSRHKVVFSKTLHLASWNNTELVKGDMLAEIRSLKNETGADAVILGSGSVVSQLAQAGLIDTFEVVVFPIALGRGTTMFEGVKAPLNLKLTESRTFCSGKVFLRYEAAR